MPEVPPPNAEAIRQLLTQLNELVPEYNFIGIRTRYPVAIAAQDTWTIDDAGKTIVAFLPEVPRK